MVSVIVMVMRRLTRRTRTMPHARAHRGRFAQGFRAALAVIPEPGTLTHHYDVVAMVLTPTEQQFATVLSDSLPTGYTVMVQVALQRVVTVRNRRRGIPWRDPRWNQIAQKSLDYVVIRSADSKIILAIELDDATHLQAKRIDRDELLDTIMRDAGVPFLHVLVQAHYDRQALQMQLLGYVAA